MSRQPTEITASLRTSKEYPGFGWRAIEIGATATIGPDDDVAYEHNCLYADLKDRLVQLWNSDKPKTIAPTEEEEVL